MAIKGAIGNKYRKLPALPGPISNDCKLSKQLKIITNKVPPIIIHTGLSLFIIFEDR